MLACRVHHQTACGLMAACMLQAVDVAVNAAVMEATARAVDKTKQEVEAANAAAKAVAEAQQLGELQARMAALEEQLGSTTDALRSAEATAQCVPCAGACRLCSHVQAVWQAAWGCSN